MSAKKIELLISDFDGTLVDTFTANLRAYQQAFKEVGLTLLREEYQRCFGYCFERFMEEVGVINPDVILEIKRRKSQCYPNFFDCLRANNTLLQFIRSFKVAGGKTALASTARRKNVMKVLEYINAVDAFDLILAGEDVAESKPSPEIYLKILRHFQMDATQALVFEDSVIGIHAAKRSNINYVVVNFNTYGS